MSHDLLSPYPVMTEKAGEVVAHFKCTIAILPKSTAILSGGNLNMENVKSDKKVKSEEVEAIIKRDLWKKEQKKKE